MNPLPFEEGPVRLAVFAGIFAVMAIAEAAFPRRRRVEPRPLRWFTNIAIVFIDSAVLRLIFPFLAVTMAAIAQSRGWGLFNWLAWPQWLEITICAIALDMAIYWQHVASHKIPMLWRFHKVHHADRDIDVTTGTRFHPVEIVLSMLYKFAVIVVLGPAPLAVFIFEVVLNGSAMFNHANLRLPLGVDRIVRLIFVTPDMHRVHHSVRHDETDSNYGFNLAWWDRAFGTYIDQPADGHDNMTIGLGAYQTHEPSRLDWALLVPFRRTRER